MFSFFCARALSLSLSLATAFFASLLLLQGGSCSPLQVLQDLTEQQKKSIAQHLEEAVEKAIEKDISASAHVIYCLLNYCYFIVK